MYPPLLKCVLPPLNSRLDSSLYPSLSCDFLHDLRILPSRIRRAALRKHQRLVSTWSARPSQSSSLHSKSLRAPIPSSIRSAASVKRNLRQLCGIREFGDLQLVLSATRFCQPPPWIHPYVALPTLNHRRIASDPRLPQTTQGPRNLHRLLPLPRRTIVDIFQPFGQIADSELGSFIQECSTAMYAIFRPLVMDQTFLIQRTRALRKSRGADTRLHSELGRFTQPVSTILLVISSLYPHATTFTPGPPLTIWHESSCSRRSGDVWKQRCRRYLRKAEIPLGFLPLTQRKFSFWPVTMSPCCVFNRWGRFGSASLETAGFMEYNGGVSG